MFSTKGFAKGALQKNLHSKSLPILTYSDRAKGRERGRLLEGVDLCEDAAVLFLLFPPEMGTPEGLAHELCVCLKQDTLFLLHVCQAAGPKHPPTPAASNTGQRPQNRVP